MPTDILDALQHCEMLFIKRNSIVFVVRRRSVAHRCSVQNSTEWCVYSKSDFTSGSVMPQKCPGSEWGTADLFRHRSLRVVLRAVSVKKSWSEKWAPHTLRSAARSLFLGVLTSIRRASSHKCRVLGVWKGRRWKLSPLLLVILLAQLGKAHPRTISAANAIYFIIIIIYYCNVGGCKHVLLFSIARLHQKQ